MRGDSTMVKKKIEDIVEDICRPITERLGLELIDIEYKKEGKNFVLRIIIDNYKGVVIEDCENVSRELSDELDRLDPIESEYILEVQSPGERNLKKDREFEYFKDRDVEVKLYEPQEGKKVFEGKLVSREDGMVKILLPDDRVEQFPVEKVANVKLIINI